MQWRSWFRLLPGMDWYSRIRSGGVQRSREWNFVAGALDSRGRSVAGATRLQLGVERTADSDERGQFRLDFVAPGPIDGGGKGVSAEQPRCHNSCPTQRKARRDAVRAIPLTVVASVMFRCAVADPVVTMAAPPSTCSRLKVRPRTTGHLPTC